MNQLTWWAPVLLAAVAGCESEPTRDIFPAEGIVRGTITAPVRSPVPDAWVAVEASYPIGNGNFEALYDSVRTDPGGHYVARVRVLNLPDTTANVTVRVWPPAEAGLAPVARPDLLVRITADLPPVDTLVVDFELEPVSRAARRLPRKPAHAADRPDQRGAPPPGAPSADTEKEA